MALAEAVAKGAPVAFQINRCMLEPPLEEELIFAQSGRPFIKNCRLRDRTGGVGVDVVNTAVPFLFGCDTEVELKEHARAQSLTSVRQRMNVRGVVREEGGRYAQVPCNGRTCAVGGGCLCWGHASQHRLEHDIR